MTSPNACSGLEATVSAAAAEKSSRNEELRLRVYTIEQVAEILQVGRDKVFMLLRTGRLRSVKIDRLRRITHRQLADYIALLEKR
ncbi:helix-turn-helix domain-containing protein [Actinomadura welshii]|uniref:helix-turn-helix domain-containing protein n=1 Tax=Actinomadura welshii TaxID=3103817 RepID=UPI001268EA81|nr:helix-turn-helix domain-containing protein [Actinomadura madurae]